MREVHTNNIETSYLFESASRRIATDFVSVRTFAEDVDLLHRVGLGA